LTGDRFPLPAVLTGVRFHTRQLGPSTLVVETGLMLRDIFMTVELYDGTTIVNYQLLMIAAAIHCHNVYLQSDCQPVT